MKPLNNPSRREFIKSAAAVTASSLLIGKQWAHGQSPGIGTRRKPNILVVMTDQQNIDTIAAYRKHFAHAAHGTNWVQTPNLDRLANRGINFLESHSPCPVCGPARASLWTGMMPLDHGVMHNNLGIAKDVPNLGEWLSDRAGYDSYFCGKWHAGGPWNYPQVSGQRKLPGFTTVPVGGSPCGDYLDYSVSASTSAFLRQYNSSTPFFYVASLMNPHDICYWIRPLGGDMITRPHDYYELGDRLPPLPPNQTFDFKDYAPPRQQTDWNEGDWRNYAYDYYRMIEKVDADVGRILDALDTRDDDTLIMFTSDHGEGLGRHLRVQKWHPFEESVKVPFILAGAGVSEQSTIDTTHLTSLIDLAATACDAAGAPAMPGTLGRSLLPIAAGKRVEQWHDSICCDFQITGRVLRSERYKYVKIYEKTNGKQDGKWFIDADGSRTVYDPKKVRNYRREPFTYLFDMKEDPWETKNLAEDSSYASTIEAHDQQLYDEWESRSQFRMHHTIG